MKNLTAVTRVGVAIVALSLTLVGCGGSRTVTATATKATPTPTSTTAASGPNTTIQDYVKQNDIQETPLTHGDPGPKIKLPTPEGWQANDSLPEAPYGAIVYQGSAVPDNPPRILATLFKLTGAVDPAKILQYAPGELKDMPGFAAGNAGQQDTLGGYDAYELGGKYSVDGKQTMIAQKTVVIPAKDGVYVLQLNAYSDESEAAILGDATNVIDEQTTIAP